MKNVLILSTSCKGCNFDASFVDFTVHSECRRSLAPDTPEPEIVSHLMRRYQEMTAKEK